MMPEILTESFCERCGTRYTFESAAPRKARRLGQIKTLSRGMKNWVMSDDTSLDEAMAAARSDEEREVTSQQLDAFHATFNFCMTCRQYTCANCWNTAEGRCLTCAPHLGHDILAAPFAEQAGIEPARLEAEAWPDVDFAGTNGNGTHAPGEDAWAAATGEVDGMPDFDPTARLAFLSGETPLTPSPAPGRTEPTPDATEPPVEAASLEDILAADPTGPVTSEIAVGAEDRVPSEPRAAELEVPDAVAAELPPTVEGRAAAGAARTSDLLRRFRPGESLDAELEAYEAELDRREEEDRAAATAAAEAIAARAVPVEPAATEPQAAPAEPDGVEAQAEQTLAEPEPLAAEPLAVEPVAVEPEPVAVEPEPVAVEPEPVAVESGPQPVAASAAPLPEPESPPQPATPAPEPVREDRVEQPTWRIFAPDQAATPPPASPSGPPQWPTRPDFDSPAMALLAGRQNGNGNTDLWDASAREVLGAPVAGAGAAVASGVQPCSNCGLSLSATARFCRRCGTRQG